jgi:hypothetical protein
MQTSANNDKLSVSCAKSEALSFALGFLAGWLHFLDDIPMGINVGPITLFIGSITGLVASIRAYQRSDRDAYAFTGAIAVIFIALATACQITSLTIRH